ncbi:MAG: DUF2809 domain-containing protein [Polaromonas sp.]|nr:DUF2809 domain-containing protein [Polaromonas sp.]
MRLRFNGAALLWSVGIFIALALIATVWSHHRFLRAFVGDLLAVVWVYYLLKTVIEARPRTLALVAFGVGCAVEAGQYLASSLGWQVANPVLRIVLGSVADWWDVLAYACGAVVALAFERAAARLRPTGDSARP